RVNARYFPTGEAGTIEFTVWPSLDAKDGGSPDRAETALFRELDRIRREVPTDGEMARAKSFLEQQFAYQDSSYIARAVMMARAEASPAGLRAAIDYADRIRAVKAEDVQRAAARYLSLQTTSIREVEPTSAPSRTFDADRFAATLSVWAPD